MTFNRLYLAPLAIALSSCSQQSAEMVLSGPTMGTLYTIKIVEPPPKLSANDVRVVIDEELRRVDETMSGYRDDSDVSRFNARRSTEWIQVSPELAEVVKGALDVSERSLGAFDISVAPIVRAWGFGSSKDLPASLPRDELLGELSKSVGYRKLHVRLSPSALKKDAPDLTIDLNGIAPGFAVDRLAVRFEALGLANFMIDIGGEVRVRGHNQARTRWRIAVERPSDTQAPPFGILALSDISVTTSGDYRHYYDRDGKRYSHTIDPRTGRPVEHRLASVVVLHPRSMYADAWATAFNVLGPEAGQDLAAQLQIPVMFIIEDGNGALTSTTTAGFEEYLFAR